MNRINSSKQLSLTSETGNYLSCSERVWKFAYTWWTNQIWCPSVLVLLIRSYHANSRHDCIRDDLLFFPTQKYAEVFQAHLVHIVAFLWYILMAQNPEGKWGVIKMSMKVDPTWSHEKAKHSRVDPTQACEQSCTWSWFEDGSDGCGCGNHSNDLQKDPGNWCLHGHAQEFEEYVVPEVKFRFHEYSELLWFSLSEWTDNPKNRSHNSIMQVTLTCHA